MINIFIYTITWNKQAHL